MLHVPETRPLDFFTQSIMAKPSGRRCVNGSALPEVVAQKSDALLFEFESLCPIGNLDPNESHTCYRLRHDWMQRMKRRMQSFSVVVCCK